MFTSSVGQVVGGYAPGSGQPSYSSSVQSALLLSTASDIHYRPVAINSDSIAGMPIQLRYALRASLPSCGFKIFVPASVFDCLPTTQ
eukprot:6128165-Amphidinium_carterae.1